MNPKEKQKRDMAKVMADSKAFVSEIWKEIEAREEKRKAVERQQEQNAKIIGWIAFALVVGLTLTLIISSVIHSGG